MEPWQIDQVNYNLPSLLSNTDCNAQLLAKLKSRKLLSDTDVEYIEAEPTKQCEANRMYNILKTRTNAYYELINALSANQQTGAARILLRISTDRLKSLKVHFLGIQTQLKNLVDNRQIGAIQKWVNDNIPSDELLKVHLNFVAEKHLQLLANTIPEPYSLYIPRLLTRRLVVNPEAFQRISPDIFVFKNISESRLNNFVRHEIDSSTNQLQNRNVTSRFIISDSEDDWERICRKVDCPVHLIKYEKSLDIFELERTLGCSMEFYEYLRQKGETLSEDMFVDMCLKERTNVCICDLPGMGKSLLLANLARKTQQRYSNSVVGFIQLKDLVPEEENGCRRETICIKSKIFKAISTSAFAGYLLNQITGSMNTKFELFLDGLDEVQGCHLESTIKFLCKVSEGIPTARIYVTSRPVMRSILEGALGVIAYDILPFTRETQVSFLTSYWVQHNNKNNVCKLNEYALIRLETIAKALKENEKDIAGIPLQCRLIADVYAEEAEIYADPERTVVVRPTDFTATSLLQIYSKYVQNTLKETRCNFACMHTKNVASAQCNMDCFVRNFHVWKALELLFPKFTVTLASFVPFSVEAMYRRPNLEHYSRLKILSSGLLTITENAGCSKVQFVHRTFAEYLVADYFVKAIFVNHSKNFCGADHHRRFQHYALKRIFSTGPTNTLYESLICAFGLLPYRIPAQSLCKNVVAYFVNTMVAPKSQTVGYLPTLYVPLMVKGNFLHALPECVREDYEMFIDLIINHHEHPENSIFNLFYQNQHFKRTNEIAETTLNLAVKYSSIKTIEKLVKFFSERCYLEAELLNNMLKTATWATGCDIFSLVFKKLQLENITFINCCVEFTHLEDADIFKLMLLIDETPQSQWRVHLPEPCQFWDSASFYNCELVSPEINMKAVRFVDANEACIWEADQNGLTMLHLATNYMSTQKFFQLCYFLFVEWNAENSLHVSNGCGSVSLKKLVHLLHSFSFKVANTKPDRCYQDGRVKLYRNFDLELFFTALQEIQTFRSKFEKECEILLFLALKFGEVELVKLLLSYNHRFLEMRFWHDHSKTPLMIAMKYKQERMISFLVSKGANIYNVDGLGNTILHLLAHTKNCSLFHEVLKILGKLWPEENRRKTRNTAKSATCAEKIASTRTTPKNLTELFNWRMEGSLQTPLHYA